MNAILRDWYAFWFPRYAPTSTVRVRVWVCAVAAMWFGSLWGELPFWFGEQGILDRGLVGQFVDYEQLVRWQLWSPLWWTDALAWFRAYVVLGILLACMGAIGVGGRWTIAALVLSMIGMAHRMSWLVGPVEPALIAFLGYFIVEPGASILGRHTNRESLAGTTLRLLQTHVWILIAAGLLTQLANLIWWRGEAVWWLAAAGRSTLLSMESLATAPLWVNALTHGIVVLEILALWLLVVRSTRYIGVTLGLAVCLAFALLADHWLYAMVLSAGVLAFLPQPAVAPTDSEAPTTESFAHTSG